MKTVINKSVLFGILLSTIFALLLAAIFFTAFPIHDWVELWDVRVFELPFIVLVLAVTVFVGAIIGLVIGLLLRRQLSLIGRSIDILQTKPNADLKEAHAPLRETREIYRKMNELQQYIKDQTKRTQKLIDQRFEDQEQQIEQVISDERNRLARELHDSVSQELFAASMMVSAINEMVTNEDEVITKQLKVVEAMIQQAQLEMRALLLHLRPVALKDKTLQEGMEQLLVELKQKVPIEITWTMEHVSVSRGMEDHLFRILQESVSNTLRHAKANSLDILLIERDNYVILRVVDDGIGFDQKESKTGSYGLNNMKERAAEIGGKLHLISVPNEGTRLEVRVPIINTEGDEFD